MKSSEIVEGEIYVELTSSSQCDWCLWKKLGGRWHIYFNGQGWIKSTIGNGRLEKLQKLEL